MNGKIKEGEEEICMYIYVWTDYEVKGKFTSNNQGLSSLRLKERFGSSYIFRFS